METESQLSESQASPLDTQSKPSLRSFSLFVAGGLIVAWLTGRLTPHLVPDSVSYLDYPFTSLQEACRSTRMPGYPLWLLCFRRTIGIPFVPAAQVIVHATAVWWLYRELTRWSLPRSQRLAVAVAVGIGCTAMDHISTISTDAIAASLGVMVATATLRWARDVDSAWSWIPVTMLATTAIFVRPAYLFLIPWLLIGGAMLKGIRDTAWRSAVLSAARVAATVVVPLILWMSVRYAVVGDFAVLPFGHQNLAGVLTQLVSDDELRGLEGPPQQLAGAILEQKHEFETRGRGFAAGEPGATMTIDARWDDMTYFVVVPAAREQFGNDNVIQHREIAQLNRAIIRGWPLRYLVWLLKAARRGAWAVAADIVMHPVFLAAICLALLIILSRSVTAQWDLPGEQDSLGLRASALSLSPI